MILTSGRLVEYEGGGDETRSNPWLAELQQDMFVEINPRDANNLGVRDGAQVWVEGPEGAKVKVKAMLTNRVGEGLADTSKAKICGISIQMVRIHMCWVNHATRRKPTAMTQSPRCKRPKRLFAKSGQHKE